MFLTLPWEIRERFSELFKHTGRGRQLFDEESENLFLSLAYTPIGSLPANFFEPINYGTPLIMPYYEFFDQWKMVPATEYRFAKEQALPTPNKDHCKLNFNYRIEIYIKICYFSLSNAEESIDGTEIGNFWAG